MTTTARILKQRMEKLEATLRRVLEWCEEDSPDFEIDADTIRAVLKTTNDRDQP